MKKLVEQHELEGNAVTVLTAALEDPTGYGRIIKDRWGKFEKIVEEKDASPAEKRVDEVNSGVYVFRSSALTEALSRLDNNNSQGEYYLTDTIEIIKNRGIGTVATMLTSDANETKGVNSKEQLAEAEELLRSGRI